MQQGYQNAYGSTFNPTVKNYDTLYDTNRRRRNLPTIVLSLIGPCVFFGVTFWLLSFSMHYKHPQLCWFVVALGALLALLSCLVAHDKWRRSPGADPTWYTLVSVALVLAWVLGVILGSANFGSSMQPYYRITSLNTYPGIDPAKTSGQQIVDAGRVMFTRQSRINESMSIGFTSGRVYCVAPIVSGAEPLASYDFWAVGTDCCAGDRPDFRCGEHGNPNAHAGMRLMATDDQKAFFQLALKQAEMAFGIQAVHPLFFHWTEDPLADTNKYIGNGLKFYLFWLMLFFAILLFMVIATATKLYTM